MAISVADIDFRLGAILNDEDSIRWTLEERLAWINDAAAEIVIVRPSANCITETVELTEGALQHIPDAGLQLLDVVRNIRADGKPGASVRRTDRDSLDDAEPDWYARKVAGTVRHFTYDDRAPRQFYVYPPVIEGAQVELRYSAPPPKVESLDDAVDLPSAYMGPIVSYVLYRALAKDSEYANGAVAAAHLQAFNAAMGARNEIGIAVGPKGALDETP